MIINNDDGVHIRWNPINCAGDQPLLVEGGDRNGDVLAANQRMSLSFEDLSKPCSIIRSQDPEHKEQNHKDDSQSTKPANGHEFLFDTAHGDGTEQARSSADTGLRQQ